MVKEADKNSRAMIESTLTSIFNQKYKGAMKERSNNWSGMMSNIADQWTRFKNMVMQGGAFDFLKGKLSDLLGRIDKMAASGQLKKLADQFGKNLVSGLQKTWQIGKELYPELIKLFKGIDNISKAVGGYGNIAKLVGGIMVSKLVLATFQFIGSLVGATRVIITFISKMSILQRIWQEIQWAVIGIAVAFNIPVWAAGLLVAALTAAVFAIYKNWKPISTFFKNMWGGIVDFMGSVKDKMFDAGANIIKSLWQGMKSLSSKPVQEIAKIAQQIRNHLPFSPAKVGPLRDIHRIKLIETIAANIKPQPLVSAMNRTLNSTRQAIQPIASGGGGSNIKVDFNVTVQGEGGLNEDALVKNLRDKLLPEFEKIMKTIQGKERRLAF